ncbi:protein FAM177A1-like isoform X2 [Neoarius graeffei]|uniref:protein FAM177A1-like isoform X2 n=1 Tax=Neoarius graeffei TaxID=443677 RepID=UPI00298CCC6B|nr:protein FAM177A1-like isoform X2 [Neoarius graeffei]
MSLSLTNIGITVTENMAEEKSVKKEFECVELGDLQQNDESGEKAPRRVIHFSSGETMEEYSTEDEEDHTHTQPDKNNLLSSVDTSKLTWGPYVWFQMWRAASNTVSACDYVGERMASLFGITSAKYQYAIDEYNRTNKQENEVKDCPDSEEVESSFEEKQKEAIQKYNINKTKVDNPENLDAGSPPRPENLDAGSRPEPENLDTGSRPEPENLDAGAPPELENLDAGSHPGCENLDAEAPPKPENLDAGVPPKPENIPQF